MVEKLDKKILDVTCGSRTIWFNKNHPAAIYTDKRAEEKNAHGVCWCNEYGGAITPEDFCSRAVRENEPPAK